LHALWPKPGALFHARYFGTSALSLNNYQVLDSNIYMPGKLREIQQLGQPKQPTAAFYPNTDLFRHYWYFFCFFITFTSFSFKNKNNARKKYREASYFFLVFVFLK